MLWKASWSGSALVMAALTLGACGQGEGVSIEGQPAVDATGAPAEVAAPPPPPVLTAADSARLLAQLEAEFDSVRAAFNSVSSLRAREVAELRQDRNAEQIAVARRLGLRASGDAEIERLARETAKQNS